MELEYKFLNNREAVDCMSRLYREPLSSKISYSIKKINEELDKQLRIFTQKHKELVEQFGKKNAEGKVIDEKTGAYEIEDGKMEEFSKSFNALLSTKFEVAKTQRIAKWALEEEPNLKISALEWAVLEPILEA